MESIDGNRYIAGISQQMADQTTDMRTRWSAKGYWFGGTIYNKVTAQSDTLRLMATTPEFLTLTEVAERMGVAKMTARRYLDAGKFPNAVRQDGRKDGRWLVPMGDVLNSGIGRRYRHSPLPEHADADGTSETSDDLAALVETVRSQARTIEQLTAIVAQLTKEAPNAS